MRTITLAIIYFPKIAQFTVQSGEQKSLIKLLSWTSTHSSHSFVENSLLPVGCRLYD